MPQDRRSRSTPTLAVRYTERLAAAGIASSVGSKGDSYDNALAESAIGLYKTEVVRRRGPWKGVEDVEFKTLKWVAWFNSSRLLEPLGYVPPTEFETAFYARQGAPAEDGFHSCPRNEDPVTTRVSAGGLEDLGPVEPFIVHPSRETEELKQRALRSTWDGSKARLSPTATRKAVRVPTSAGE